jgi:hypothetical protein
MNEAADHRAAALAYRPYMKAACVPAKVWPLGYLYSDDQMTPISACGTLCEWSEAPVACPQLGVKE